MRSMNNNEYSKSGALIDGYDYENQCWVLGGVVQRCGHPENMNCECYGRLHAGEKTTATKEKLK